MRKVLVAACGAALLAGCEKGGATRLLTIDATGIVRGVVYFDANGSRTFDAADAGVAGARVRLLAPAGRDTLYRATALADGTFRLAGVAVGTYEVVVDSASVGDSVRVVTATPALVQVLPGDSVEFTGGVSFPIRTVAEARAAAPGTRLFVRGIALHARETFSDTTLHVVDGSGGLRASRIRPGGTPVAAGDSVVLRGTISTRLGQPVLDDVHAFVVRPTFIPTAPLLTTAAAATASAGTRDAQLVRLQNAQVTDTATVAGNFQMTMNDGSGAVVVVLDRAADAGFRAPLPAGLYVAPNRFDLAGVLVPTGTGAWRVRPRSALDLVRR
jgi:hypothetical protein